MSSSTCASESRCRHALLHLFPSCPNPRTVFYSLKNSFVEQFLRGGRTTSGCFFVFQSSFIVSFTNTPVTGTSADISVMAGLLSYSRYLQSVAAAVQYWRPFTASEVQLPDHWQPPFCSRGTNRLLLLVEQLCRTVSFVVGEQFLGVSSCFVQCFVHNKHPRDRPPQQISLDFGACAFLPFSLGPAGDCPCRH